MRFSASAPIPALLLGCLLLSCTGQNRDSLDFTPEFSFTEGIEGPAVNAEGHLFAVNYQKEGTIGRMKPDGQAELFISLPEGSIGNGIRFDLDGNMYVADYVKHRLYRVAKGKRLPELWAQDSSMNQPNDLAIGPGGLIYLSDPNWADSTGQLWMLGNNRELKLLEKGMGTTNGIEVSPDGKTLYVNESVQRKVWQYELGNEGLPLNKKLLIQFPDYGLDGMRCDSKGNLYIARYGKGTVAMVSPDGNVLREFKLKGEKPSNITFGGIDGRQCYVTMADRGCIETFTAPEQGNYFTQIQKQKL